MSDQLDMFSALPAAPTVPAPEPSRRKEPGGGPQRATEVMVQISEGRFGVLDNTDRIVWFEDDRHVRHSPDEDVVASLIAGGYAGERGDRYRVGCRHGAIIRPVTPLRLTPAGKKLLTRWRSYVPLA